MRKQHLDPNLDGQFVARFDPSHHVKLSLQKASNTAENSSRGSGHQLRRQHLDPNSDGQFKARFDPSHHIKPLLPKASNTAETSSGGLGPQLGRQHIDPSTDDQFEARLDPSHYIMLSLPTASNTAETSSGGLGPQLGRQHIDPSTDGQFEARFDPSHYIMLSLPTASNTAEISSGGLGPQLGRQHIDPSTDDQFEARLDPSHYIILSLPTASNTAETSSGGLGPQPDIYQTKCSPTGFNFTISHKTWKNLYSSESPSLERTWTETMRMKINEHIPCQINFERYRLHTKKSPIFRAKGKCKTPNCTTLTIVMEQLPAEDCDATFHVEIEGQLQHVTKHPKLIFNKVPLEALEHDYSKQSPSHGIFEFSIPWSTWDKLYQPQKSKLNENWSNVMKQKINVHIPCVITFKCHRVNKSIPIFRAVGACKFSKCITLKLMMTNRPSNNEEACFIAMVFGRINHEDQIIHRNKITGKFREELAQAKRIKKIQPPSPSHYIIHSLPTAPNTAETSSGGLGPQPDIYQTKCSPTGFNFTISHKTWKNLYSSESPSLERTWTETMRMKINEHIPCKINFERYRLHTKKSPIFQAKGKCKIPNCTTLTIVMEQLPAEDCDATFHVEIEGQLQHVTKHPELYLNKVPLEALEHGHTKESPSRGIFEFSIPWSTWDKLYQPQKSKLNENWSNVMKQKINVHIPCVITFKCHKVNQSIPILRAVGACKFSNCITLKLIMTNRPSNNEEACFIAMVFGKINHEDQIIHRNKITGKFREELAQAMRIKEMTPNRLRLNLIDTADKQLLEYGNYDHVPSLATLQKIRSLDKTRKREDENQLF